ncbi:hypothetical protein QYE76_071609 [Lolium multiflorum]|uniref:Retrotransposon gag domain-containing protein n=1 Tax=Lolium multiflorum TaxID=4521 RepID=A0AAD8SL74_LOLMU|nr:hypothetical protein QYE76_071609 [Lolium multiflorum]
MKTTSSSPFSGQRSSRSSSESRQHDGMVAVVVENSGRASPKRMRELYVEESGSLGSFLDATIAKSRQIENLETPNENATPVNSPESVEYSSDDLDEDYVELDDDFIEKCNATTARKIKKLLTEHAVRYKPSPDPKFATSPINIRDKDYDFSLDLSHIAIVEKTPFCGTEKESAVEHLTELSTLSGVFSDDVKMRTYFVAKIFPFSLKDDAKTWYNNLPPGSIKSPIDLRDVFFRKYFPASAQHAALQRIYNFDQEDGEKLPEAWARFCSLIRAQPDHDLEKHDLLDIFYSGLTIESRAYLDSCAGCVFRKRTPDDAEELLAKIGRNHDDWSTPEPTPTPIVKRGMIKLNDEDMREAKKSLEKGIKPEDVKNLPPIEDICETIPPSSMIEDFEFHRSQTDPMVRYKIYNKTIDLPFSDFCTAIRVPRWGSCEKIRGTPRELSNLYTRICNGRSFSNDGELFSSAAFSAIVDATASLTRHSTPDSSMAAADLGAAEWERSKIMNRDLNLLKKLGISKKPIAVCFPKKATQPLQWGIGTIQILFRFLPFLKVEKSKKGTVISDDSTSKPEEAVPSRQKAAYDPYLETLISSDDEEKYQLLMWLLERPTIKELLRIGAQFIGYHDYASKTEEKLAEVNERANTLAQKLEQSEEAHKTSQEFELEDPDNDALLDAVSFLEFHGTEAREGIDEARTGLSRLFPFFFPKKEEPATFLALAKCFNPPEDLGLKMRHENMKVSVESTVALVADSQQIIDWAKVGNTEQIEQTKWRSLIKAAKFNTKRILSYLGIKPSSTPSSSRPEV